MDEKGGTGDTGDGDTGKGRGRTEKKEEMREKKGNRMVKVATGGRGAERRRDRKRMKEKRYGNGSRKWRKRMRKCG